MSLMFQETLLLDIPPGSLGTLKTKFVLHYRLFNDEDDSTKKLLLYCPQSDITVLNIVIPRTHKTSSSGWPAKQGTK